VSANPGIMRIGEVHAQLRKDFPDVELSKIRYYEDKGLVQPSRSRKGYRLYSDRDVACLREAIRLAQEEFVPLRVVRLRLIEQGLLVAPGVTPSTRLVARDTNVATVTAPVPIRPVVNASPDRSDSAPVPIKEFFTTNELLSTTGLEPETFNQLQSQGLVCPVVVEGETLYGALDVRIAAHARALIERGVEVRQLGSLRRIAEREVGVVDELTSPLRRVGTTLSPEQIAQLTGDVAREVAALRTVLVERELGIYLRD
jgi:hypothetical protein